MNILTGKLTELPPMRLARRRYNCGTVNGKDIVVSGGGMYTPTNYNTTEIFSLDEWKWRRGQGTYKHICLKR